MANVTAREQRIRLQLEGSPIKLDASILWMSEDGKKLKVRFDGPLDDTMLYGLGNTYLTDECLTEGSSLSAKARLFRVL